MHDKFAALLDLGKAQAQVGNLFVRAEMTKLRNDYEAASQAYQEYIQASQSYLEAAVEFNRRFPQSPFGLREIVRPLVNAMMVGADIESSLGRREAAEALRNQAISLSHAYLGREGSADAHRARAASLTLEGRFNEAIVALMEARDVMLESGDNLALARIALDLADVLHWLGDNPRAADEIAHASTIIEPLIGTRPVTQQDVLRGVFESISGILGGQGDPQAGPRTAALYRVFVEITFYRGLVAKSLRKWDEAEACFEKVRPDYRQLGTGEAIEFQFAHILVERGEYAAALQRARGIAGVFERGAYRAKRPVLYKLMAQCLHALGDSQQALRLLREAIDDLQQQHFDPDALWHAQHVLAQVLADLGDHPGATRACAEAIATVSALRRAPLGYRLDSTFLADKMALYAMAIEEAGRGGLAADCCTFMDGIKSRTLTAVLGSARLRTDHGNAMQAQFDALTRELDAIEYTAYREGWSSEQQTRHRARLDDRANLLERLRISDPRWRNLSESPALDLGKVSGALSRRSQAALSFYYDAPELSCVLLWHGEVRCARQTLGDTLVRQLDDYAANLSKPQPDVFKHDLSSEYGIQATDLIPRAFLDAVLGAAALVVVPHGSLHLLPWAALIHQGKRLFELLPVAMFPNVALLAGDAAVARPRSAALLGVAGYRGLDALGELPSTGPELADIAGIYADAGFPVRGPYLDSKATEAAYQTLGTGLSGVGHLLHLSCHGTIVPHEPMNSGLLLFDSKLDAAEVAGGLLPFDEVVLSACSTGWRPTEVAGIPLNADEILGIPGAFLEAGAQSVLVSISKAEGRAARALTTHYHRRRVAGDAPMQAMQAAQKHMLESGISPSAWAGFSLYSYV